MSLGLIPKVAQKCYKDEYTGAKDCATHNIVVFIVWQIGDFLNSNGAAIAALSGVAVAVFTFTLWRSTDKLWSAGERQLAIAKTSAEAASNSAKASLIQARAMVASERAYMVVDPILTPLGNGGWTVHATNAGRTRAHCKSCTMIAVVNLPENKNWINEGLIPTKLDLSVSANIKTCVGAIYIPTDSVHVLGRLIYSDVFNQTHHEWFHYGLKLGRWFYLSADDWNRVETFEDQT